MVLASLTVVPILSGQVVRPPLAQPEKQKKTDKDANAHIKTLRVDPPDAEHYRIKGATDWDGTTSLVKLRGHCPDTCAELESIDLLIKADEIDYNRDTEYAEARGHVFYESFTTGEKMYAEKAEYQVDERTGQFYGEVHGTSPPKIDARPGLLTTSNPFYFEGSYAEKIKDRIKLYDGFVTDCLVPRPAWKLTGHKFDIIPHDRAIAYHSIYRLRGIPLFYTPIFYKSLKKNPRRSGFLLPDVTHSSLYGWMTSMGLFLALGRSFDLTYHPEYMSLRGLSHAVEFRGRPTDKSDFDFTLHGVSDKLHQGGYVINAIGHDDLGGGWQAVGQINYLSNFLYRQAFNTSFTEAISSETHSVVDLNKHWDAYGVNIAYSRDVNFQSTLPGDTILLRKLPEVEFIARDQQINDKVLPIWFSLDTTFGLLHRDQPDFQTVQFMTRTDIAPRISTAFNWKGFSLMPSFTFRDTFYSESFNPTGQIVQNRLVRNSRETDIEFLLPTLERVFKAPKIFGSKMKHTIEARANYRLVQGVQNFNEIIRFDSTELLTNTNEVEISLTNRLYVKSKDGQVKELFSWQLWQRRYFDPTFGGTVIAGIRNVNLSTIDITGIAFLDGPRAYSPIVSAVRFQPNHLNLEWRTDYDPKTGNIVDSAVSAGGRWDNYFINFGSNQLRTGTVLAPSSNQFTTSFGFGKPNKRGWNMGATMFYDYRTSQLNYLSSQVTRNWDCCGLSVQYRRLNYGIIQNNVEQFSFSISNIGSFGTLRKQESIF